MLISRSHPREASRYGHFWGTYFTSCAEMGDAMIHDIAVEGQQFLDGPYAQQLANASGKKSDAALHKFISIIRRAQVQLQGKHH